MENEKVSAEGKPKFSVRFKKNMHVMHQRLKRAKRFISRKLEKIPAHKLIPMSFAVIILVGTLLLLLPFSVKKGEEPTGVIQALFVATSATCVTGLTPFDTATHWSLFGQTVIILLIQTGGLGAMTIVTSLALSLRQRLGLRSLRIAQESTGYLDMGGTRGVLKVAAGVTLICEGAGALLLSFEFIPRFGFLKGVWSSVFTAISAYCNAGFDVLGRGDSVVSLNSEPYVLMVLSSIIILGGLGFAVFYDIINVIKEGGKVRNLMMHTKIVCVASAVLLIIGTLFFLVSEWNGVLQGMSFGDKLWNAFFQSVCARSAGFASVDLGAASGFTKLFFCVLMFIGASPGSTGGGVKTTTMVVLITTVVCTLKGYDHPVIGKRRITRETVYKALAICATAISGIIVATVVILGQLGGEVKSIDALYEAVSAFGTVGVTAGITDDLPRISMMVLCLLMFLGRVGPISLSLSISSRSSKRPKNTIYPDATIISG